MLLDLAACYEALRSRDARSDGRLYVGVSSTGIYCRPVCTSKPPKRENCHFFPSAAAAEAAGFRPCLRCRPELAPDHASADAGARLAQAAASLIDEAPVDYAGLAQRLSVTDEHLGEVFQTRFGVTPSDYARTQRLLLAKRLLTDTRLPLNEIARASGLGSPRRLNEVFRQRYRLIPSDLRRKAKFAAGDVFESKLAYRPPLDWSSLLGFLAHRSIAGVEAVDSTAYRRSVTFASQAIRHTGWIEVTPIPRKPRLRLRASAGLANVLPQVLAAVKRLCDLACDPQEVAVSLGPLAERHPGLRLPGAFDAFELAVRAVLGQQITVRAARTLAGRFAQAFGEPADTPFAEIRYAFPTADKVAVLTPDAIAKLGVIGTRARTIIALAQALHAGRLRLLPGADVHATLAALKSMPGIGEWTAQYIAMRALAWPDAFPHTDYGVMKALGEKAPGRVLALAQAWRPWRAYAVMHLWKSLE